MHREDLSCVLLPSRHGKLPDSNVKQLDAAVSARSQELVLMLL
jgi:hypothetical protein